MKPTASIDFGMGREPQQSFLLHEHIIEDRSSRYSVSIGHVQGRDDVLAFLKELTAKKKYAKADHNSWAVRIAHGGTLFEKKNDDGETGAGMVILRVMQKEDITNAIICVTRWFGGTKLMNDRYTHIQNAAKYAIAHMSVKKR